MYFFYKSEANKRLSCTLHNEQKTLMSWAAASDCVIVYSKGKKDLRKRKTEVRK